MASLSFIMHMDDDVDPPPRPIQKDAIPATTSTSQGHGSSSISAPQSHASSRDVGQSSVTTRSSPPPPPPLPPLHPLAAVAASSAPITQRNTTSSSHAAPVVPSPSRLTASASRRESTTSLDSMDHTGYGSGASSSSIGGGRHPYRSLSRPISDAPAQETQQVRLTPITKRVSRAKKGVPVHVCDTCRPPKTFTRAEHLRRHQLSHQNPAFPCPVPGCDKTFHRQDLLTRHQSRHEHDGDQPDPSGVGGQSPESHPASTSSHYDMSASDSTSAVGGGSRMESAPSTARDLSSTASFSRGGYSLASPTTQSEASASSFSMSRGARDRYSSSNRAPSQAYDPSLSPGLGYPHQASYHGSPAMADSIMSGSVMEGLEYSSARGDPAGSGLYLDTQNLPSSNALAADGSGPPDHCPPNDTSPWPSSNSESTHSTGSENVSRAMIMPSFSRARSPRSDWNGAQYIRQQSSSFDLVSPSYYMGIPPSPQIPSTQGGEFGTLYEGTIARYPLDGSTSSMTSALATSHGQVRANVSQHRHNSSFSSVRSSTPPLFFPNSTQPAEPLVIPSTAIPGRIGGAASRRLQKALVVGSGYPSLDTGMFSGGLGVFGLGEGHPQGDSNGLFASFTGGCGMPVGVRGIQLARALRNAIPGYLDVYWKRFHSLFPVVHRPSLDGMELGVLHCAMAAIATQYLDGKEDRARGSQLHEIAWLELKTHPPWNLQVMQAILLLEYFARFRGKRTAVRPSTIFQFLYSRVSSPQFLASDGFDQSSFFQAPADWSSSSSSCSGSSTATLTPTSTAALLQQQITFSAFASNLAGTVPSHFPSSGALQQYLTSTPPATPVLGQEYSPFAQWQVHFPTQNLFGTPVSTSHATPEMQAPEPPQAQAQYPLSMQPPQLRQTQEQATLNQVQWSSWVEEESRRRLLQGCFLVDVHTYVYHEQRRTTEQDPMASGAAAIPLVGHTGPLWEASSADEWASLLAADPSAEFPCSLSVRDALLPDNMPSQSPLDRATGLAWWFLRGTHQEPLEPFSPNLATPTMTKPTHSTSRADSQLVGGQAATAAAAAAAVPVVVSTPQNSHDMDPQGAHSDGPFYLPLEASMDGARDASNPTDEAAIIATTIDPDERISELFADMPVAHAYLALRQTPLHSLCAVSGESWMFCQKITDSDTFQAHKKRLRLWVDHGLYDNVRDAYTWSSASQSRSSARESGLAEISPAKASIHATRALLCFLNRERDRNADRQDTGTNAAQTPASTWMDDISDYWALYVCSLIIWAYARRHERPSSASSTGSSAGPSASSPTTQPLTSDTMSTDQVSTAEAEVEQWLRRVAELRPDDIAPALGKREAGLVVGFARRRLDREAVGGKSRLLTDACGVLKKLEEGINWPWF